MTYVKPNHDLSAFSHASDQWIPAGTVNQNTRAPPKVEHCVLYNQSSGRSANQVCMSWADCEFVRWICALMNVWSCVISCGYQWHRRDNDSHRSDDNRRNNDNDRSDNNHTGVTRTGETMTMTGVTTTGAIEWMAAAAAVVWRGMTTTKKII